MTNLINRALAAEKKLFLLCFILCVPYMVYADEKNYTNWEHEDVVGIYTEISNMEAKRQGYDESYDDGDVVRYFTKVRLSEGKYEVEVSEKVDSKFWSIRGTAYFMKFRFNPYLYRFDEGILVWNGWDGVFYKKP